MVDKQSVLLVDIGNTSLKWVSLAEKNREPLVAENMDVLISQIKANPECQYLYVANVRSEAVLAPLVDYCQACNLTLKEIHTQKEAFGITNSYQDTHRMGVDRWLAMVAAQGLTDKPFAVLDLGTAITCDFVWDGMHQGGWIAPGFHTMRSALLAKTSRVSGDERIPPQLDAGKNTEDGVANGCLAAVRGVFLSARGYISAKQDDFCLVVGGGDKKLLTSLDQADSIRVANLVVQGLARYAEKDLFA